MKIETLQALPRGIGHTSAAAAGVNFKILIVRDKREADRLNQIYKSHLGVRVKAVPLSEGDRMFMGGVPQPVVMDIDAVRVFAEEHANRKVREVLLKIWELRDKYEV